MPRWLMPKTSGKGKGKGGGKGHEAMFPGGVRDGPNSPPMAANQPHSSNNDASNGNNNDVDNNNNNKKDNNGNGKNKEDEEASTFPCAGPFMNPEYLSSQILRDKRRKCESEVPQGTREPLSVRQYW